MPIYEYECPHCGAYIEKLRPIEDRLAPVLCPHCGDVAQFRLSRPGRFQRGPGWHARMDGTKIPGEV